MADEKWQKEAHAILHLAGSDPSGYLGRLTEAEQKALDDIRAQVNGSNPNHGMSDADLLRYLRAREFNLQKTFKMISASLAWIEKIKPASIPLEECRMVYDLGGALPFGKDKVGRQAMWFFTKHHKPKEVCQAAIKNAFYMMTYCTQSLSPGQECFAVVFDLEGYGMKNADLTWCWNVIDSLQNHYPERMGMCLLLSPPSVFSMLWKVVKPWLAPRTVSKIHFIDGDVKHKLRALFDADQIPAALGGTGNVTPQGFIQAKCGPPPPPAAKKKGWFSWGRRSSDEAGAGTVLDAPPPMEALGEEGKKVMDSCVQENDKESEDGSSK